MTHRRRFTLVRAGLLLLVALLVITGCTSDDKTDSANPTVPASITPPLTRTPAPSFTPMPTFTPMQSFNVPPTATQLVLRPTTALTPLPTWTPVQPTATLFPYDVRITYPVDGSQVAGFTTIMGSASHPRFVQYALEWGPDPNPSNLWYPFSTPLTQIILNGALGAWNTTQVRDGVYQVRVHVWLNDGTDVSDLVTGIRVSNQAPTAVPTSTPTLRPNQQPAINLIPSQQVNAGQAIKIAVSASDPDGDAVNLFVASSNPAVAGAQVTAPAEITVSGVTAGTAVITVTGNDNFGGSTSTAFMITVLGQNRAPVITPLVNQTLKPGETRELALQVSDPDGETPTVAAATGDPAVVTVSVPAANKLVLTGVGAGTANVTITANDGKGGLVNSAFQVTISAASAPPKIDPIANQTLTAGSQLDVSYNVVDTNGVSITGSVTAQATSSNTAAVTASVTTPGTIRLAAQGAGSATITLTVNDGVNPAVNATFDAVVSAPSLPVIQPVGDQTLEVGTSRDVAYTVTDANGNALTGSVTGQALADNEAVVVASVPAPGTIRLQAISGGSTFVTLLVSDGINPTQSVKFNVVVTAPTVLTIQPINNQLLNVGSTLDVTYNVVDSNGVSQTGAVTAQAVPDNPAAVSASVLAPGTVQLSGSASGTATVTLSVSGAGGQTASTTFVVTVNAPPVITPVGDQALIVGQQISVPVTITDPDDPAVVLTAIALSPDVVMASAVGNNSVTLQGINQGSTTVELTADDARGGLSQVTFLVNVSGGAPTFNLMDYPVLPDISPAMASSLNLTYQGGLGLGNQTNAFIKVGDDPMDSPNFMAAFTTGPANLGSYGSLQGVIDTYVATSVRASDPAINSLNVDSVAAGAGYGIDSLSGAAPAGPPCDAVGGGTNLSCELALSRPSIALISFSAPNVMFMDPSQFRSELQSLVSQLQTAGVIPVLATIPAGSGYTTEQLAGYNQAVVEVASAAGVPLWNLWRAMQERGIGDPNSVSPSGAADLTDPSLAYGYNIRNLTALQSLQLVRQAAGMP